MSQCLFCRLDEDCDDGKLNDGKFIKKNDLSLHYFCMLFSSGLSQRGKSTRMGIFGFLEGDIKKELTRGKRLRCLYCNEAGATIGCNVKQCKKKFHLPCGIKNDSLHQFFGRYISFCSDHRPRQETPFSDRLSFHGTTNSVCPICLSFVESRVSNQTLRTPCCRNTWIHRKCVQAQAMSAGYFFKCPVCNDKPKFQVEMLTHGIYVPEQDASWERDTNAFQDLLFRHNQCDHPKCRAPKGPKFSKDGSPWQVILCESCGSEGCHIACGKLKFSKPVFVCDFCKTVVKALKERKNPPKRIKTRLQGRVSGQGQGGRGRGRRPAGMDVYQPSTSVDHASDEPVLHVTREMSSRRIRQACVFKCSNSSSISSCSDMDMPDMPTLSKYVDYDEEERREDERVCRRLNDKSMDVDVETVTLDDSSSSSDCQIIDSDVSNCVVASNMTPPRRGDASVNVTAPESNVVDMSAIDHKNAMTPLTDLLSVADDHNKSSDLGYVSYTPPPRH